MDWRREACMWIQMVTLRKREACITTDAEERLMARPTIIGDWSMPRTGTGRPRPEERR